MLISPAYAQGFVDSQAMVQFLPFILIFVVMYFLLLRPQQKKAQDLKKMLAAVRRGDRVVTGGGIIGTVAKVIGDDELLVDIAEGTRVRVLRGTITAVLAKADPSAAKEKAEEGADAAEAAGETKDKRKGAARGGSSK